MGKEKGTHPTPPRQGVLGIPEPIWRELWEVEEMRVAPSRELEREFFGALTHQVGQGALWEEAA
ncbi:hypothetical protein [Thermus islandicus]|uniref:hypothetical protein n=1 Tax=Thermus islandicus TaxID=540988 RepID=UPI0003B5823B|nr:hypothetical protein [Thermus islandicus]